MRAPGTLRGTGAGALLLVALTASAAGAPGGGDWRLGERIYREGLNARDEPIRSLVGLPPSPMNGAPAACGACHALTSADGGPTANAAPELRWAVLAAAAGRDGGTQPYSERSFALAISEGIAPSGKVLSSAMPRYALSRSEIAALVAFLKTSPADRKPR